MSRGKDFSASDYQPYWKLTAEERSQKIQDEQVPVADEALLLFQQGLVMGQGESRCYVYLGPST